MGGVADGTRRVSYRDDPAGVSPDQLRGFFEGWPDPPTPEAHLRILHASAAVVLAWDDDAGRAAGFITAVSDGVLAAYIPLLEVLPAHRGRGVGAELVRRMLARLDGLYMIDAVCDDDVRPFYERLGFTALAGMARRRRAGLAPLTARAGRTPPAPG